MTEQTHNQGVASPSQPDTGVVARERALALADEIGVKAAARQLGIPVGTVKSWRSRSGRASLPAQDDWLSRKQQG